MTEPFDNGENLLSVRTKLNEVIEKVTGVQDGATKNATDAQLRDRSTHTGTQTASTISDLAGLLSEKIDAVPGKGLSDENYTLAEKQKLAELSGSHFKGVFEGLDKLQQAYAVAEAGDYAMVDDGTNMVWYKWDDADGMWIGRNSG